MGTIKNIVLIVLLGLALHANAQTDKATTKSIIEAKNFIFVASAAIPMNSVEINSILNSMPGGNKGGTIDLVGDSYDVRVRPDSVIAYLPYYGRSFNAPVNRDDNGFKFTSTKFSFNSKATKKGGWEININPQDTRESVRMSLNVSSTGYATLIVSSNNKQTITYTGYMAEPKR